MQGLFEEIAYLPEVGWFARGWAYDPAAPGSSARLTISCEEGMLATFVASQFSPELAAAGIGDGHHAFRVKLPEQLIDGHPHMVEILAEADGRPLPRRTKGIFHPPCLHGHLDAINHGVLHGWAFIQNAPSCPPVLTVEVDNVIIGTVTCDDPWPSPVHSSDGTPRHRFRFPLPAALFDGHSHAVSIRFANTDQHLKGSPMDAVLPPHLLTSRRRMLDRMVSDHMAELEDMRTTLSVEPLNWLNHPQAYAAWLRHHETAITELLTNTAHNSVTPTIAVHTIAPSGMDAAEMAAIIAAETADAVVFLTPKAALHPAFLPLAQAAMSGSDIDLLYTDEDERAGDGERLRPHFKPAWDPDRYRAFPYVGFACVIARHLLIEAAAIVAEAERPTDARAWVAAVLDTALLSAASKRVRQLPFVLYHDAADTENQIGGLERAARVQRHLDRVGVDAVARPTLKGRVRVHWNLPAAPPQVTFIVPTRDRVDLLEACLDSVLSRTRYPRYDIVVIDNDSREPATLAYLERIVKHSNVWVRRWPRPFNYAAMHNAVIGEVAAPYVALLNNDVEVIEPEWLEEMMGHAVRPEVGAVGAKLLYPNGTIQHGGVLIGQHGVADHAQRAFAGDEDGYFHSAMIVQNVSAVSAACMVCRRADYIEVGGMDATNLTVAFNDVDLCLKLGAHGRRLIWTPHAVLFHRESASRKVNRLLDVGERERREAEYIRSKWKTEIFQDPYYSPNLTRGSQTHIDFNWRPASKTRAL